jgi:hypothetical protein
MIRTSLALIVALALIAGPPGEERAAAAKHKKKTASPAATVGKRAAPAPRPSVGPAARRVEPAATNTPTGDREAPSASSDPNAQPANPPPRTAKTKTYTFGAMDVEGKLKTPQLLYFLNRVKLELEMSAPDHRSFMKELEKTADDPSL